MPVFLIVDDNPIRCKHMSDSIKKDVPRASIHVASSAKAARDILCHCHNFDTIFLDTDLGDGNGCGTDVADFIASHKIYYNAVVIHSMNWSGAARIKEILPHAVHMPYSTFYAP